MWLNTVYLNQWAWTLNMYAENYNNKCANCLIYFVQLFMYNSLHLLSITHYLAWFKLFSCWFVGIYIFNKPHHSSAVQVTFSTQYSYFQQRHADMLNIKSFAGIWQLYHILYMVSTKQKRKLLISGQTATVNI